MKPAQNNVAQVRYEFRPEYITRMTIINALWSCFGWRLFPVGLPASVNINEERNESFNQTLLVFSMTFPSHVTGWCLYFEAYYERDEESSARYA